MCTPFIGRALRSDGSFRLPKVLVFKPEIFFLFSLFSLRRRITFGALSFSPSFYLSGESPFSVLFSGLVLLVALDPSYFSLKIFFVGVCRVAEREGRALDLGDLVSLGCVLCRLSEELFDLVSPALDTWKVVKGLMVSEGNSWSLVRSEDLPEGLSGEGGSGGQSEETPSVSGSSRVVGPEDSWIARSYLSLVVDVEGLEKYRRRFQIPTDVVLRIPESDEVACSSKYGDMAFYEADFRAGLRFPL